MKTTWSLAILFIAGIVNGAELRVSSKELVVVVAPDGWKATKDRPPVATFPFETFRIEPSGNRNEICLVTVYDKEKPEFSNAAFLKKLLKGDCQPYVSSADVLAKLDVKEMKIEGGLGFYANFIDPDLVGKPIQKGKYKTATPIIVTLNSKYLIKITMMCDEIDGADYRDAMTMVKSIKVKKE